MNFGSYSELEKEIDRLKNNHKYLLEAKKVVEETSYPLIDDKNKAVGRVNGEIAQIESQIKSLEEIQTAYNTYIDTLKEIQDLYYSKDKIDNLEEKLNELRDEVSKAKSLLPEGLLNEAMQKVQEYIKNHNEHTSKPTIEFEETKFEVNFKEEVDKFVSQMDGVLKGKSLDELRYGDLLNVKNDYLKLVPIKDELFSRIKASQKLMDKVKYDELMSQERLITQKLKDSIKNIDENKKQRDTIKKQINKELREDKKRISTLDIKRKELEEKVNHPEKYNLSAVEVDKLRGIISLINKDRNMLIRRVHDLNVNLNKINDGGIISKDFIDSLSEEPKLESINEIPELSKPEMKPKAKPTTPMAPAGKPSSDTAAKTESKGKTAEKSSKRKKGEKTVPKAVVANSLEDLIKTGKLPKFIDFEVLKNICSELNIPVKDKDTVLNPEQIDRLQNDHEIQVLLLCEKIYERNSKMVSEYDKLISKYESILKDKMKNKDRVDNFSPEYIQKVQKLMEKLKEERVKYIQKNERLKVEIKQGNIALDYDGRDLFRRFEDNASTLYLEANALSKNEKLRSKYRKLDELRSQKYKSKFRNNIQEKRIQRVLDRIEQLKAKKSEIAKQQTQIINENTDLYISKITDRLQKFLNRQNRIEQSVDKINSISDRISQNRKERINLQSDLEKDQKFIDKVGMVFEDGRLERQTDRLETQRDLENFVGRFR